MDCRAPGHPRCTGEVTTHCRRSTTCHLAKVSSLMLRRLYRSYMLAIPLGEASYRTFLAPHLFARYACRALSTKVSTVGQCSTHVAEAWWQNVLLYKRFSEWNRKHLLAMEASEHQARYLRWVACLKSPAECCHFDFARASRMAGSSAVLVSRCVEMLAVLMPPGLMPPVLPTLQRSKNKDCQGPGHPRRTGEVRVHCRRPTTYHLAKVSSLTLRSLCRFIVYARSPIRRSVVPQVLGHHTSWGGTHVEH